MAIKLICELGVKAPFVKLEEAKNNNLIISCMDMRVMSKSPHKALLLLHELPECNKERLQSLCIGWFSFKLHFKCWFVPIWVKESMKKITIIIIVFYGASKKPRESCFLKSLIQCIM